MQVKFYINATTGENMNEIIHYATGGTIDSAWHTEKDTAVTRQLSSSAELLTQAFITPIVSRSEVLCLKDSREISKHDMERIAASICETSESRNLVTSGTYLMPDMARKVANHAMSSTFDRHNKRGAKAK
jgi:L-asparaginase/Glu-tRNA(Gln) amidotransferase subunit D